MANLNKPWRNAKISFATKLKLNKALVLSILLYGCESWTLTAELEKRIQAFEMKCLRRVLGVAWTERKTNKFVRWQVELAAGTQELLLATAKRRKLQWYGHVTRHSTMATTILQGTLEGGRRRGRPRKSWSDNVREWSGMDTPTLVREAENRHGWRKLSTEASRHSPLCPARARE